MKVLFIEDDPIQVMVMGSKFKLEGFNYFSASNGKEALNLAAKESPDIVLLDVLLGGENGLDVLENHRKNKKIKNIPVIIFTNYLERDSVKRAEELGAIDFIIKAGVTPKKMVEIVNNCLKREA
jgi:DNA-binding NtrC family response regulator